MRVKSIQPAYDILQLNAQQVAAYVIVLLSYHRIPKTVRRRTMRWPKTRPATLEHRSIVISIKTRSETYRAKLPHHTVEHANHKNRRKKKRRESRKRITMRFGASSFRRAYSTILQRASRKRTVSKMATGIQYAYA